MAVFLYLDPLIHRLMGKFHADAGMNSTPDNF